MTETFEERMARKAEVERVEQEERDIRARLAEEERVKKDVEHLQNSYLRRTGRKEMKP